MGQQLQHLRRRLRHVSRQQAKARTLLTLNVKRLQRARRRHARASHQVALSERVRRYLGTWYRAGCLLDLLEEKMAQLLFEEFGLEVYARRQEDIDGYFEDMVDAWTPVMTPLSQIHPDRPV